MAKTLNFKVSNSLTLTLQDLWANIEVRAGSAGVVTVELKGDDKLLEQIKVTQPNSDEILIKGAGEANGGLTVIQSGGRSSISVGNISNSSSVVIGGSIKGRVVISDDDVVVISGGKVLSGGGKVNVITGDEIPTIIISVPQGTDLVAYDVTSVDAKGLGGKLNVSLSGQGKAVVENAKGMKLRCSGQSSIQVTKATGDLKASTSGQSNIQVSGQFGDVEAESSGQSHVTVNGPCNDCEVESSGQSGVNVSGPAKGKVRKNANGQSHVYVG